MGISSGPKADSGVGRSQSNTLPNESSPSRCSWNNNFADRGGWVARGLTQLSGGQNSGTKAPAFLWVRGGVFEMRSAFRRRPWSQSSQKWETISVGHLGPSGEKELLGRKGGWRLIPKHPELGALQVATVKGNNFLKVEKRKRGKI